MAPKSAELGLLPTRLLESLPRPQTPTKSLRKGNSIKQRQFLQVIIQRMHNSHSSDKSTTKFIFKKRWGRGFCLLKTKIGQKVKRTRWVGAAPLPCDTSSSPANTRVQGPCSPYSRNQTLRSCLRRPWGEWGWGAPGKPAVTALQEGRMPQGPEGQTF